MTESLKFGPEWLRNTVAPAIDAASMSSSSNTARYPLAEFRYGREEMLSLFDKNIKLPEIYSKYKKLFVDKIQGPLALTPSTDEEMEYSRNVWPTRSVGTPGSTGRGRGISAERGRGRGRSVYHPSYQRSTSLYDEEGRSIGRGERPWLERNGSGDVGTNEYGATTSPRKEYGRVGAENWRRSRTDEEGATTATGSDWRSSGFTTRDNKWAGRSWRDDWEGNTPEYQRTNSNPTGSNGTERSGPKPYPGGGVPMKKRSWGDGDDSLPEWATEDPSDYGGSFDATGAFHDSEDDDLYRNHHRSPPNKHANPIDPSKSEKPIIRSDIKAKVEAIVKSDRSSQEKEAQSFDMERKKDDENRSSEGNKSIETPHENKLSVEKETSPGNKHLQNNVDTKVNRGGNASSEHINQNSIPQTTELRRVAGTGRIQNISESSVDRMQEVADDMVAQLMMEDELINAFDNDMSLSKSASSPLLGNLANNRSSSSQQQPSRPSLGNSGTSDFWFYQDPQNKVQGPFSAAEMSEWYRAGYFDETLFVRRGCDSRFSTLGDLIKVCGGAIPFISSHLIPAMVTPELPPLQNPLLSVLGNTAAAAPQILDNDVQLKYQLHVLQKQFMMRQQQLILQKLMATEPWSVLSAEQQNTMLNHHMAQVTLPDNLLSTASLVGLNPAQLQQLQQQTMQASLFGSNMGQMSQKDIQQGGSPQVPASHQQLGAQHQSNSHNVPSNMIQQMNQQNNSSQQPVSQANHQHQQQRRANNNSQMQQNPDQIRQLIHSMSLGHLQQQQQPVNSNSNNALQGVQPQPKMSPIEADPIKSLIMQLSMQKNSSSGGVPVPAMQPGGHSLGKPMHPGSTDSVFPWGMLSGTGGQVSGTAGMQHLMQNSNNQFHHPMRNMPGFNLIENELDLRKNEQQQTQQQQQQWNTAPSATPSNKASSLLSMWEMPPIKTPVINNGDIGGIQNNNFVVDSKTDQEKQRHFLMEEQRHLQQHQQSNVGSQIVEKESLNNYQLNAESKHLHDDDIAKFDNKIEKDAKRQNNNKKEREPENEAAKIKQSNNNAINKKIDATNVKTQQQSTKAKTAQKEADDKKRKAEDKKKLKELKERQQIEEKRKQEEMMEQQRKSKLLEAQRRETALKIQEEQLALQQQAAHNKIQQQNQQRPVTQMAPWSNSLATGQTGPSLIEIEKAERQQRAEQMRMEQEMRAQREQQQLFEMQQKQESILKWNAQNIMPAAVKSLAEIQAEEHAKQTAVEKELAAQNAAKQREEEKKGVQNMASFWSTTAQQSAWNTGKIWGSGASSNYSTSGGGFWEEPTKAATNQKVTTSSKLLAKSQTMGSITTNKGQNSAQKQQESQQQQQSKTNKQLSGSTPSKPLTNNKPPGAKPTKSDKKSEDSFNAEFNNWCVKALSNLNADVDVPTFVGFLQDIESPYEIKDYIKMYLGETKECIEFSKQFLERRSKLKNQQRAQNAHIDDMCSPAPALTPNDFQEVKNKTKKVKKGKMTKVDNRMLGFSVTAAPHWNLEKNMEDNSSS